AQLQLEQDLEKFLTDQYIYSQSLLLLPVQPIAYLGQTNYSHSGRAFQSNLVFLHNEIKRGSSNCYYYVSISSGWEIQLLVQEGWRGGGMKREGLVTVEEMKGYVVGSGNGESKYRIIVWNGGGKTGGKDGKKNAKGEEEKMSISQSQITSINSNGSIITTN